MADGSSGKRKAPEEAGAEAAAPQYVLGRARSVDVVGFVEARAFEINALQRSLEDARASGSVRAFQTLPRHLRRRAASHNVKRMPARLRERAMAEMAKSAQSSKALAETGRLTNGAAGASRYKRRRARTVREEYELRQGGKRWLETHVWHAKRMRMAERWGAMVAETPNERSHRAAYRAAKDRTHVQDVSFYRTLELAGPAPAVAALVRRLAAPGGAALDSRPCLAGARAAPLTLHRAGRFPLAALGPALALWQPQPDASAPRRLWLRVHPAHADAVRAELAAVLAEPGVEATPTVRLADVSTDVVSFELLGAQSTPMLATVLAHVTDPAAAGAAALRLVRAVPSPAVLSEGVVLALRIHDPRLRFPYRLDPADAALRADEQPRLQELLMRWPAGAADLGAPHDQGIWDRAACARDAARRPAEHELNERRQRQLVPGTRLEPDPAADVTVPVLLVRTGPEALLGARVAQTDRRCVDAMAHGWTLLAPRGWGMALWMALNFAGARPQGLSERHHIGFEAGLPTFPANWPGTAAYDQWAGAAATAAYQKWARRPPGKRANYLACGIQSPFFPPFHALLGISGLPEPYPAVTPDGLECRLRRIKKIASKSPDAVDPDTMDLDAPTDPAAATAAIWLLAGDSLAAAAEALLAAAHDAPPAQPPSFHEWAAPLLAAAGCVARPDAPSLLDRCLVRVRLACAGRGVLESNAPICLHSAGPADDIGYVMTGSFSLARGSGMAIGACSLHGLFRLWAAAAGRAAHRAGRAPRVLVRRLCDAPPVAAVLTVLP
ncbi:Ribonucleases P/MRP protein subunit pop1 [Coemansia javaensis]|uniref:Ribonucleases P/MRP protein subunit pop1 n=1 Tax=Coemansia javaensis TaxID=2761396 RepID=A0A9W8HCL7_9FUNG|nr:Ribonucleases P/MRP protein subunit pop1 [Coemansia javaensis]